MTQLQNMLQERSLGDEFSASAISFGAMGMSEFYGTPPDDAASLAVLDRALELGVSMIDTADMYGRGHNERLIAKFIARHPMEYTNGWIRIATKFGIDRDPNDSYKRSINNSPVYIRRACEGSLQRLGVERIDLYYAHRIDPDADISETMGILADLKREGKIAHIGLCEVSAATLEKAHAVHPVAALQSEYSLWTREVEDSILPLCHRLGIGFVAYSPLGRGFLTGKYTTTEHLETGDFRLSNPRFQGENLRKNSALLAVVQTVADKHGCTLAQTALAWLLSRYEHLVVIPGTRSIARLEENCRATAITLSEDDIALLNAAFTPEAVHGQRYTPEGMKGANA
ncbi:MAG: aldo/keto reductase [Pseudomonadota bacterium]|nr:aldo/keto reductase [Pseudomonadota bacterium]